MADDREKTIARLIYRAVKLPLDELQQLAAEAHAMAVRLELAQERRRLAAAPTEPPGPSARTCAETPCGCDIATERRHNETK